MIKKGIQSFLYQIYMKYHTNIRLCINTNKGWMLAGYFPLVLTKDSTGDIGQLCNISFKIGDLESNSIVYLSDNLKTGDIIYAPISLITKDGIKGYTSLGYSKESYSNLDSNPNNLIDFNLSEKGISNLIYPIDSRLGFIILDKNKVDDYFCDILKLDRNYIKSLR